MTDNPLKDYKDAVRANLPIGMSYNEDVARYQLNEHSFFTYKKADWYDLYIRKFGYVSQYGVGGKECDFVADFIANRYYTNQQEDLFSEVFTHSRASTATYVDSTGTLQTAAINTPRIGHHVWDGSAWVNAGLLHESDTRTNLLLNSGTLSTQSVTVSAVPHTLHFTGTGTITLSGASSAGPLVGAGDGESNRVSLTFTPTAGTLTLTVSGTVSNAQLEAGPTRTSYIPTVGSAVTRAGDVLTIAAGNLPPIGSPGAYSVQMDGRMNYADIGTFATVQFFERGAQLSNVIAMHIDTNGADVGQVRGLLDSSGVRSTIVGPIDSYLPGSSVPFNIGGRFTDTAINIAIDGIALGGLSHSLGFPNLSAFDLALGKVFNGTIEKFRIWATDIGDVGIAEASS